MVVAKKTNFLTKEGYEKLIQELREIQEVKIPAVIERISDARAMGDLSENSEYKSALEDRELLSSRIAQIESLLKDVEIIDDSKKKKWGMVDFGSKVEVELEDGKKYTVTMVGTWEVAIEKNNTKVSFESPLGIAIKGKKVGDKVKMRIGNTRQIVKVLSIK